MRKTLLFFFFSLLFFPSHIFANGLEISVAGDMAYNQGLNQSSEADDKLTLTGAEVMFYAPIDHQFDGVLSLAAHDENGETLFEIHELMIASSKLIPRSNLRIGQFFLGVGRLNRCRWVIPTRNRNLLIAGGRN